MSEAYTAAELADAELAVAALLRAFHEERHADADAITGQATARELRAITGILASAVAGLTVKLTVMAALVGDDAAVEWALSASPAEITANGALEAAVAANLAGLQARIIGEA